MTKRHFIALAQIVSTIEDETTRNDVAEQMAKLCAGENPRFDFDVFYKACDAALV